MFVSMFAKIHSLFEASFPNGTKCSKGDFDNYEAGHVNIENCEKLNTRLVSYDTSDSYNYFEIFENIKEQNLKRQILYQETCKNGLNMNKSDQGYKSTSYKVECVKLTERINSENDEMYRISEIFYVRDKYRVKSRKNSQFSETKKYNVNDLIAFYEGLNDKNEKN